MTLVEITIATAILALVMGAIASSMQQEARSFGQMATLAARERKMSESISHMESLLQFAQGTAPRAFLTAELSTTETRAQVDVTAGLPPTGSLLLRAAEPGEEIIDYETLRAPSSEVAGLSRGAQCSEAQSHTSGSAVFWAGMAEAVDPATVPFHGQAQSDQGTIAFRGHGSGFSFRVPTDPSGNGEYFDELGIRWGSTVNGVPTLEGWSALQFRPIDTIVEADDGRDLNGDGDTDDTFDRGRIELVSWNAFSVATNDSSVAMCPPIVLQERCNWGGDLDGDGFEDPLFLWLPEEGRLEMRVFFSSGTVNERRQIRSLSKTVFLRNGSAD